MEDLLNKKMRGFRFKYGTDGIAWNADMNECIGLIGVIIKVRDLTVVVQFNNRTYWAYPLSLVREHLVEEKPVHFKQGKWKVITRIDLTDTGIRYGHYQLTDGKTHLHTTTQLDIEEDVRTPVHDVADTLNASDTNALRAENERLRQELAAMKEHYEKYINNIYKGQKFGFYHPYYR
jgi:hypothetical protein